ncbi:MAG: hypothetical protein A2Z88_07215 [Omnitrophica WOR_2 bacterium GWA2_47_8]|nr:MAG: hypothetical protein A2Z88_07215 [Omnitrophica WOR_2 bacterium GWA2_47_8]
MINLRNEKGTVLIFALWALGLLAFLAVTVGILCRQKILLFSSLERKSQLRFLADAGVKQSVKLVSANKASLTAPIKMFMHNDKSGSFIIDGLNYKVTMMYEEPSDDLQSKESHLGVVDEERKLNLNEASFSEIKELVRSVLGLEERGALNIAASFIEWREGVKEEIVQFLKEDSYGRLNYPPKKGRFETLDEILLVEGMSADLYERLIPFVTIYGDGKVNINTAPYPVLSALGLKDKVIRKVMAFRRGNDAQEATADDNVFFGSHMVIEQLQSFTELSQEEIDQVDSLNVSFRLKTTSDYFFVQSRGKFKMSNEIKTIQCVYDSLDKRFLYWREI